jgi:hypothetical protein
MQDITTIQLTKDTREKLLVTTIQLTKDTREKLLEIGKKKETYDDLINRLIEFYVDKERN